MQRTIISLLLVFGIVANVFAQEKKPTLMILPSDNWCHQRFYTNVIDNQGVKIESPDYQLAFREDPELTAVISKVGQLLSSKGYSLKDAEQEIKSVYTRLAEDNVTTSKSGASLYESPLDIIKRRAKMDIVVQLWWRINKEGSRRTVSFTLEAFDAYTNKRIATSSGVSDASTESVPLLLEKAANSRIKDFDKQMMVFYNDRKWIRKNTVGGAYNLTDATENMATFEQVRIPLLDADGDGLDARGFATSLRKYLSKEYGITSKVMTRGLGEATIVLGEK